MTDFDLKQAVLTYLATLSTEQRPIYLVGGAVRDQVLQRPVHDLDFVLPGPTSRLARSMADAFAGGYYCLDEARDTNRVILQPGAGQRLVLDFATLRASTLEDDLRGRDFTLNALAYDVAHPERLIDPTGGLVDLRAGLLRACGPSSLTDDPVRVLRAVRQASHMQFRIEPSTLQLVRQAAPLLQQVSPERQRDELVRILSGQRVSQVIWVLDHLGILQQVLPELDSMKGVVQSWPHVAAVWEHTLGVVRHLERLFEVLAGDYNEETGADLMHGLAVLRLGRYREQLSAHFERSIVIDRPLKALLYLAALYHDVAKPATRQEEPDGKVRFLGHQEQGASVAAMRARKLAFSSDEVERVEKIVRQHMRVHFLVNHRSAVSDGPTRRAIYRYFRDTGDLGIDICLLSLADTRATYETTLPQETWAAELDVCRALMEAYWEEEPAVISPPRLISGEDILKTLGLRPGPLVGKVLEAVREAQAVGEVSSREEALVLARRWVGELRSNEEREEG